MRDRWLSLRQLGKHGGRRLCIPFSDVTAIETGKSDYDSELCLKSGVSVPFRGDPGTVESILRDHSLDPLIELVVFCELDELYRLMLQRPLPRLEHGPIKRIQS